MVRAGGNDVERVDRFFEPDGGIVPHIPGERFAELSKTPSSGDSGNDSGSGVSALLFWDLERRALDSWICVSLLGVFYDAMEGGTVGHHSGNDFDRGRLNQLLFADKTSAVAMDHAGFGVDSVLLRCGERDPEVVYKSQSHDLADLWGADRVCRDYAVDLSR